ncbi:histidinol dehydrogenase [Alicycliphilus sp. B1]|nr:histidinol dehydrogenase [Alicycliphilus sp. B1]
MQFVAAPARLSTVSDAFEADFAARLHWSADQDAAIEERVAAILADVQQRGDAAVLDYTRRFDGLQADGVAALELTQAELKAAYDGLPDAQRQALSAAAARVRSYHEAQKKACGESWSYRDEDGTLLGQKVTPLGPRGHLRARRQGGLPEQRAHERHPRPRGRRARDHHGRAHAQGREEPAGAGRRHCGPASRAPSPSAARRPWPRWPYGTATIPKVDKITGPGNAYVASAKKRVFGQVGIDMIAGPSEILVLADGSTPPDWVAMDLFSQAEHDELAPVHPAVPRRRLHRRRAERDRPPAAPDAARRDHRQEPHGPRRADPHAQHGRGLRNLQPHRARAPGSLQPRPAQVGAAAQARRRHLPRRLHQRKSGRLLRRPQPRAAHERHGAVLVSPLGVYDFQKRSSLIEVSEAGRPGAGPHRQRAGARRGACRGTRARRRCG